MNASPAPAPCWQPSYLRELCDRALDLVVSTISADADDPDTLQTFARQAIALRTRLEPFLHQVPSDPGSWLPGADPSALTALFQVHGLLQAFLGDDAADLERLAERLDLLRAVRTGALPAAVNRLCERITAFTAPPVVLTRFGGPVRVRGVQKAALTFAQHQVVRALLDAGETGLSKDELEKVHSDARGILRRLRDLDPDWRAVIHFAGRTGGRYRIG